MGFWSKLLYYRPGDALHICSSQLANFVQGFSTLGMTSAEGVVRVSARLQPARSWQDARFVTELPTGVAGIHRVSGPTWDVDEDVSLNELAKVVASWNGQVHLAHIVLGELSSAIRQRIERVGSPENSEDFVPEECTLLVGPIEVGDDDTVIGHLGVGIGGNGYLFPWTLKDLVARAESTPEIRAMMAHCREFWPVEARVADIASQQTRKVIGRGWPYDRTDVPAGWCWGLQGIV